MTARPDPEYAHGAMYEDYLGFSFELLDEYCQVLHQAITQVDSQHLILSPQLNLDDFPTWSPYLEVYAKYFSIFMINMYPNNWQYGLSPEVVHALTLIHERTSLPLCVSEWSVPSVDSELYNNPSKEDWSWEDCMQTQAERSTQASAVALDLYNLPFMVGTQWFEWLDVNSTARTANRGLCDSSGNLYENLWNNLTSTQMEIVGYQGY